MVKNKIALKNLDTYIYIDVSNIRSACLKTLGFRIDFVKLLNYFKRKYPNLKDVRYYEGIAKDDQKKHKIFNSLKKKGYTICSLERKSYNSTEIEEREARCPRCKYKWTAKFKKEHTVMKSNVDVYLASDMVAMASRATKPIRLILVSCDGDYAEAIKTAININENVSVVVMATPSVRNYHKNTVSVRLKNLVSEIGKPKFLFYNIDALRKIIESI